MSTPIEQAQPTADVAVIGTGEMGSAIITAIARSHKQVLVANRRGPESLRPLDIKYPGIVVPTTIESALQADTVILAVPWQAVHGLLNSAPAFDGRILIDVTNAVDFIDSDSAEAHDPNNPLGQMGLRPVDLHGRGSSQLVQEWACGARVVKALNHLDPSRVMSPEPHGGRTAAYLAGDDPDARASTAHLLERIGLSPIDLGELESGERLFGFPFGSLAGLDLVSF